MFVAIMCRMRYFGGGFGRMPRVRRTTRLTKPRGFFSPDISVSSACSVPMPPPMPPPPLAAGGHEQLALARLGAPPRRRSAGSARDDVVRAVARRAVQRVPRGALAHHLGATRLAHRAAAAAEGVGLVEEHDDPAVAQRQLAQLAVEALDLEDADPEEHVDERARVDEHVRLAGLAGDRLGQQRLAGAGRAPEQDAAGDVAALLLDRLGVLEEDDVLPHALDARCPGPTRRRSGSSRRPGSRRRRRRARGTRRSAPNCATAMNR